NIYNNKVKVSVVTFDYIKLCVQLIKAAGNNDRTVFKCEFIVLKLIQQGLVYSSTFIFKQFHLGFVFDNAFFRYFFVLLDVHLNSWNAISVDNQRAITLKRKGVAEI
ncbi:hypothetical protein DNF23_55970, partial [Pseudomonas syringae pv. pisi]